MLFRNHIGHMAFDALRHPVYAYAHEDEQFDREAFVAAVEAEQYERAEGMVARALEDGLHWNDLEQAFVEASLLHYNDFGHCQCSV